MCVKGSAGDNETPTPKTKMATESVPTAPHVFHYSRVIGRAPSSQEPAQEGLGTGRGVLLCVAMVEVVVLVVV